MFPEVVGLAHALYMAGGNAAALGPDVKGFVVFFVYGYVELVFGNFQNLSEEFPGPGSGFFLEVVAKGEVAQHFKVGAVAVGLADVFNVGGADALLAAGALGVGCGFGMQEVVLQGCHARVDEQQAGVILGHKGSTGKAGVVLAFKERQERLAQFVYTGPFHSLFPPGLFFPFIEK